MQCRGPCGWSPLQLRTTQQVLASWPYPCSLVGQTLSRLGVCPARLVPVRVAGSLVSKLYVPRPGTDILQRFSELAGRGTYCKLTREPATRTGTSLAGQTPRGERVWPARLHGYGQLARTCCVVLNCSGLHPHGPLLVYPWSTPRDT